MCFFSGSNKHEENILQLVLTNAIYWVGAIIITSYVGTYTDRIVVGR